MGGYIRGVAFNGLITGALAWAGLSLLDVPYAAALGAWTAMAELIPYLGPLFAGALATGAGLLVSTGTAIEVAVLYTALQQLENHLLQPNIMHRQTHVPAGLVLFAFTAGFMVGGLLGALVAIPIAAATRVLVVHVVAPSWRNSLRASADRVRGRPDGANGQMTRNPAASRSAIRRLVMQPDRGEMTRNVATPRYVVARGVAPPSVESPQKRLPPRRPIRPLSNWVTSKPKPARQAAQQNAAAGV